MNYNSRRETKKHIKQVQKNLKKVICELKKRAKDHDKTKLKEPEKELFDEFTPKLKNSTYMSDEYKNFLTDLKPALNHHYLYNRHHPEHFENGISDMSLVDFIEMICDWDAACRRHADGDIKKSIEKNSERFGYDQFLINVFLKTTSEVFKE